MTADLAALTAPLGDAAHPVARPARPRRAVAADAAAPAAPRLARRAARATTASGPSPGSATQAAIVNQELLAREAGRLAGAYEEVADRLRRLAPRTAGLALAVAAPRAGRSACAGLGVLGPALRDVLTASGPGRRR